MVSLLCGCCNKKKDFTFYIERVLFFRSSTENLNASINENYDKKDALFDCGFFGNSCIRDKRISSLFGLGFYFSAYTNPSIKKANAPLHMHYNSDDAADYEYRVGTDFLTPSGKINIMDLPSSSEISSYFDSNLFFSFSDRSDYFYFCVPASFNYAKYTSRLSFSAFSCYSSSSPFFRSDLRLGLLDCDYTGIHTKAFNLFSIFSSFVNKSFVYEFSDFINIFENSLSSFYSQFYSDVTNFNLQHRYLSVYRFSKKEYYAYLQNYTTARQ